MRLARERRRQRAVVSDGLASDTLGDCGRRRTWWVLEVEEAILTACFALDN